MSPNSRRALGLTSERGCVELCDPLTPPSRAADRELARAIEQCVGREGLLAELQRARTRIAAGMREIEQTPTVPAVQQVSSPTGKRRDGPSNLQETARRAAVLERVQAGELDNAAAARELGTEVGAWGVWESGVSAR